MVVLYLTTDLTNFSEDFVEVTFRRHTRYLSLIH